MADVDSFLKIDGIQGESQDAMHKGEIEVETFHFAGTQHGSMHHGSGGGTGKVHMGDFIFVMNTNKASPKLLLAMTSGEHFHKAVLAVRKAGKSQQEYLKWTFTDVLVSSFHHGNVLLPDSPVETGPDGPNVSPGGSFGGRSGAVGRVIPIDRIGLNFAKIEVEYKEQKADGTVGAAVRTGWDFKQNKRV
jgi:type VI secretion system secreted protein Hcp